jgi:hypothetical protein
MTQAYPLQWPRGRDRNYDPINSKFKTSLSVASGCLYDELNRLGAVNVVLSSNMKYRGDGLPYSRQPNIDDTGVAVYFTYQGNQMCFACDQYYELKENVQAIRKTIEALRGIERWGSSDMMKQAFQGFEALPAPTDHWQTLGILKTNDEAAVKKAFRTKVKRNSHPDNGGTVKIYLKLVEARNTAITEIQA